MHGLLSLLITTFLSWHTALYEPQLPQLPVVSDFVLDPTLTLAQKRLTGDAIPLTLAQSFIVMDLHSGEILLEKNADVRLFPASTTKVMTALVALEAFDLSSVASVSATISRDGSHMGLLPGERITIENLLAGLLIQSANDAASTLAAAYPGGEKAFVAKMNETANKLSLRNTHFTNPIGFSEPGHVTSVRDLVILSKEAMKQPGFAKLVSLKQKTVANVDGTISHKLTTTNELLGRLDGIEGIKTGWTQESGECFVAQATRGDQTLLTAVLNSPNRFQETKNLIEWTFANYTVETKPLSSWEK